MMGKGANKQSNQRIQTWNSFFISEKGIQQYLEGVLNVFDASLEYKHGQRNKDNIHLESKFYMELASLLPRLG